jgi:single-stranded DNA-binding protein
LGGTVERLREAIVTIDVLTPDCLVGDGKMIGTSQFVPVQAWGRLGEAMAIYAAKSWLVLVEGRISVSSWEATPGERRYITRVIARTIRS